MTKNHKSNKLQPAKQQIHNVFQPANDIAKDLNKAASDIENGRISSLPGDAAQLIVDAERQVSSILEEPARFINDLLIQKSPIKNSFRHNESQRRNNNLTHSLNGNRNNRNQSTNKNNNKNNKGTRPNKNKNNSRRSMPPQGTDSGYAYVPNAIPTISQRTGTSSGSTMSDTFFLNRQIFLPTSVPQAGVVFDSIIIDRTFFNGSLFEKEFGKWEKFTIKNFTIKNILSQPSTSAGMFWCTLDGDPADALNIGINPGEDFFKNHHSSVVHSLYGAPFSVSMKGSKRQLFSDAAFVSGSQATNTQIADIHNTAAGCLTYAAGSGITVTSAALCTVQVSCSIHFEGASLNDNETVITCGKSSGLSGSQLTSGIVTSFSLATAMEITTQGLGSGQESSYSEWCYQTPLFDGQAFHLYPGDYYLSFQIYWNTSAVGGSWQTSGANLFGTGAVYTEDLCFISNSSTPSTVAEWVHQPSSFNNPNYQSTLQGRVRITGPNTGLNYATYTPNFSGLTTGSYVSACTFIIQRMANIITVPYGLWFPRGNTNGQVSVKNVTMTLSDSDRYERFKLISAELDNFRNSSNNNNVNIEDKKYDEDYFIISNWDKADSTTKSQFDHNGKIDWAAFQRSLVGPPLPYPPGSIYHPVSSSINGNVVRKLL